MSMDNVSQLVARSYVLSEPNVTKEDVLSMLDIAEEIKIVEVINSVKEGTALINVQRSHAQLVLIVIVDNAKLI